LREPGSDLPDLQSFFKEDLGDLLAESAGMDGLSPVSMEDIKKTEARMGSRFAYGSTVYATSEKEMACPHCGKTFLTTGH